ncbi:hypothetical protein [Oceanobacillus manasiensis]|uniref:hypothetical protein n=1 Tax=Oceanobacillus manasiensis TaxID=586413 RepID=UPI000B065304|nr:hypothetical protein [Oceanobacillus manasiensis]
MKKLTSFLLMAVLTVLISLVSGTLSTNISILLDPGLGDMDVYDPGLGDMD